MQNPNENIFDVLDEMRKDSIETEDGVITLEGYADRVEKCICNLVEEVKGAVNQAWYESLNSVTEEFDRRIRENLMEKALGMLGMGAANDDGRTETDGLGADTQA